MLMAFDNTTTVVGNLTRDPETRHTPSGATVVNFGIAWNQKGRDGQPDKTSFFDVTCWGTLADNVAASLRKGERVIVYGRLEQRSWGSPTGEKRSKVELVADEVSPSLRWASVQVSRNQGDQGGKRAGGNPAGAPFDGGYNDSSPF